MEVGIDGGIGRGKARGAEEWNLKNFDIIESTVSLKSMSPWIPVSQNLAVLLKTEQSVDTEKSDSAIDTAKSILEVLQFSFLLKG